MTQASAPTAADRIRLDLEARIADGTLPPGAPLDEAALAAAFGVSRTPVRDALLQLGAHGFVRIVPRVGIFVAELDADALANMFETLAYLEGLCAGLAARRIDPATRRALRRAHQAAEPRPDGAGYGAANQAFHAVLYEACGNPYLIAQIVLIRRRTQPYRLRHFDQPGRVARSWREHGAIVAAVLAGDVDGATRAATAHIVEGGREFRAFAARFPQGLFHEPEPAALAPPVAAPLGWLYGARANAAPRMPH
ncbi:GntR family transcriptional regulator [Bordetella genomosp. 1]|uniref:HTH gntR-type domain-containing protein n=1 Tax=Bordetella genomosp. 1 TaxID=1395607 RepID=A0ABX4F390_9BORD|nr:GntR family transcriptional regulator [Bordetella genomosp. 1]OZI68142.1 hypothetical protein CAL27_01330 [Bordetella genomosp. 1]